MGPEDFDYELAEDLIAQHPLEERTAARMLVDLGNGPLHLKISNFPELLKPGDVVVVNNTRVLPARLFLKKETGGVVEVLLLKPQRATVWEALVRPSRKVSSGTEFTVSPEMTIRIGEDLGAGKRSIEIEAKSDLLLLLEKYGEMPLPPYIKENLEDGDRYQTIFANRSNSAAAPTAGLHFTEALVSECKNSGAQVEEIELAIGLDTFRPLTVANLDDHDMHSEFYSVPKEVMHRCKEANRVIAIGTTTVRALESAARFELSGQTNLFIRDPFEFKIVDLLLTNFHLPKSTLLVMLEAFIGPYWRDLYTEAQINSYRFLSFGDSMLVSDRSTRKL